MVRNIFRKELGILWLAFASSLSFAQGRPPVAVKTVVVQPEKITIKGEALGTTRAYEGVSITANVTETIAAFHFEEGAKVEKGDLLVTFTRDEEMARRLSVVAAVDENKRELRRLQRLVGKGAVPQSQVDARATDLAKTEAELQQIEAQIADRTIRAPFEGVVGIRNYSVGALVRPGDVITSLDMVDTMKVDINVPASYLPLLQINLPIQARSEVFGEEVFDGKISHIDTRIDPVSRSLKVRGEINNQDGRLKPGLFLKILIVTEERESLLIPEMAVIFRDNQQFVFRVNNENVARSIAIQTGARYENRIEVTSGLNAGDRIITEGIIKVNEGSPVRIIGTSDSKPPKQAKI